MQLELHSPRPTLFFNKTSADKEWRFHEKVIACIESMFIDRNLEVWSNLHIQSKYGYTLECDVVYGGSVNPNGFIEIRDRRKKVGRNYVEEVLGKARFSLDLPFKISSTLGFSAEALKLARGQNIELRILTQVPHEEIKKPFKLTEVNVRYTPVCLATFNFFRGYRYIDAMDGRPVAETSIYSLEDKFDSPKTALIQFYPQTVLSPRVGATYFR